MIQLRAFQPEDAEKIISWVDSPLVFYQWCAGFLGTYPITAENLRQYYEKESVDTDYHVLTAFHEQGIFAHLTMRFLKEEPGTARIGFLILDTNLRGQGYGKKLMREILNLAFSYDHIKQVTLGVFENNPRAKACYTACGFQEVDGKEPKTYPCMGEEWQFCDMKLSRADWEKGCFS